MSNITKRIEMTKGSRNRCGFIVQENKETDYRGWSQACFSGALWPGPEAMGTTWNTGNFLWSSENTFILWGWLSTGTGVPEKLWSPHLWRHSKASGYGPGQPALADPVVAGELDQVTCGGPLQFQLFCDSEIAWLSENSILYTMVFWFYTVFEINCR